MARNNPLGAAQSPTGLRGTGVRRINNLPVCIAAGIVLVFMACVCVVGALRGTPQTAPQAEDHGGSASQYAHAMVGDRAGGMVGKATTPGASPSPSASPAGSPSPAPTPAPVPTPDDAAKRREAALAAALRAKPGVEDSGFDRLAQLKQQQDAQKLAALRQTDPNNADDVMAEYRREQDAARAFAGTLPSRETDPNDLANFINPGTGDRWTLKNRVLAPPTPYVLQTGSIIPAISITAMDSDLPGAITAQVSQNVYDSPSGRYLLIPQGARLYGEYVAGKGVGYGQSRLFVAWQRIIFPNGTTLDIGAMPGADGQGMAGLRDLADSHWLRTFGSALLMSAIVAGTTLSQPRDSGFGTNQSASGVLSEALGQNLGTAMSQLLEKNLNVAPTLKIRAGFRFNVMAVKDLVFTRPYPLPAY